MFLPQKYKKLMGEDKMSDIVKGAGINGVAGRVGRLTAFQLVQLGVPIGSVNDLAKTGAIVESLANKDGVHGTLDWKVERRDESTIAINGSPVRVFHEKDPAAIEWGSDVYAVAECAGPFVERSAAEKHFTKNPQLETVLISAPGKGDLNTYVMAVNHTQYNPANPKDRVVSNASCTTKALSLPLIALINAGVSVYAVLMDTTHAATNTQRVLGYMSERGSLNEIVSSKTGAAIATTEVIPLLKGKMDGFAMRVPTTDGSFANFYFVAEAPDLSVQFLNGVFKGAVSDPKYLGRIDVYDARDDEDKPKEVASTDIVGNPASSIMVLAKTKSILLPHQGIVPANQLALIGAVSGYDNELGPAKDLAMLTQYVLQQKKA